jgi:molybdopterin molybdotransferase
MNAANPKPPAWSIGETLALIRETGQTLEPERVALAQAHGRVLREPVRADADQPPFDRSAFDGYAIRLDDAATVYRCVDRLRAGDWRPRTLQHGETVRVATGAALPGDGLQVVMQEDVEAEGDHVTIRQRDRDRNIRFRGDDARGGQVLVEPGTCLSAGGLALLASVGCTRPSVTRLPRVLHIVSGNEIVPCDQTPVGGQIRDSNSTLVRAFLNRWNIEPVQLHATEDINALAAVIDRAGVEPDRVELLLISGGASVGDHDFTRAWLAELGYTLQVQRTAARPGKPMILASSGSRLAFGLPGNPLAHFACLNLYVRQALRRLLGAVETPLFTTAPLARDLPEPTEASVALNPREILWPARIDGGADGFQLTLLPWRSSGDITALAAANALARIPPSSRPLKRGDPVLFLPTNQIP